MLKIRRYESRDFADYVVTLEKTTSLGKEAEDELKSMLAKVSKEQVWVAEVDGRAVGFMILTANNDGSLEVDWLDVHPDFQRKGIGTSFIEKAVEVAKEKRLSFLSVHTWEKNKKMLKFLFRNGFEIVDCIKNFYGKGKDALRLKKNFLAA